MAKIIEAKAVISAEDKTGATFAAIANKMHGLEKAGKMASSTMSSSMSSIGAQVDKLNAQLSKVDNFKALHQGLVQSRQRFREAQTEVERLARTMSATAEPSRQLNREFERAQRNVSLAARAFENQAAAVKTARSALEGAGIPLNRLSSEQARLRSSIEQTTAAMRRQAEMGNRRPWGSGPTAPSGVPLVPRPASPASPTALPAAPGVRPEPGKPTAPPHAPREESPAGVSILAAAVKAVTAAADIDTERQQMVQAGWTPGEVTRAERKAENVAIGWRMSKESAMRIIREGRPTFGGDLDQTLAQIDPFFAVRTAMRQKNAGASDSELDTQLGHVIRASEIGGFSKDPGRLSGFIDFMTKMAQVHGSALRGEEVVNFFKSGKTAASTPDFEFLKEIFPTLLPEQGGDRLGTALMTLRQAMVGGKMKHKAAKAMERYGLINTAGLEVTKDDEVMGVRPEHIKGGKLFEKNPAQWVRDVFLPTLDAKGVRPDERAGVISEMFSDRNAEYVMSLLVTEMARMAKDRATVEKALGTAGTKEALVNDAKLVASSLWDTVKNVSAAAGGPWMPFLKGAGNAATDAMSGLAGWLGDNPGATKAGTGALVGGGGSAALRFISERFWQLPKFAQPILNSPLMRTGPVGGIITGAQVGSWLGQGASAIGSVFAGKYWTPQSSSAVADLQREISDLEKQKAGIQARTHPSRRGEFNPQVDQIGLKTQDAQNRVNAAPAEVKVQGTVEGQAKVDVNVKVEASPELKAIVSGFEALRVKLQGLIASGVGSTGTSTPEAHP